MTEPVIKAGTLRRAAEAADGMRGRDVYLQVGRDSFEILQQKPTDQNPDRVLIQCRTDDFPVSERPTLLEVLAITSKGGETKTHSLRPTYDAVFWSESAIEKFVQPYYARMYGVDACVRLCLMQQAWRDPMVFAIGHLPKSEPFEVKGRLELPSGATVIESSFHVLTLGLREQPGIIPEEYALQLRGEIRKEAVS